MNNTLIKLLINKNILKYDEFTLRGGIKSNYYCDIKESFGYSNILNKIIKELLNLIPENTTCIAGSGYGGITLASIIAYKKGLFLTLIRNKTKSYGTNKIIEGYIPNNKDKVCIIDDVFTTGSSISETKEILNKYRVKFTKSIVVLNRSNKKNNDILSLLRDKDLNK